MKTDNLTSDTIGKYIPNVMTEVAGEKPLADKLAPYVESAKLWLESEYLGTDDFLSDAHNDFALKIIVAKAFADAVPSLDLIVTPTGMAVINTDNLAPASKERVERLISSLRDYVRVNVALLLDICRTYETWRQSERGRYFGASFINSPADYESIDALKDFSYGEVRFRCVIAEAELADRYLGRKLMASLRNDFNCGALSKSHALISAIRSAVLALIVPSKDKVMIDQNRLWHVARPILNELNYYPDLKELWASEMGDKFASQSFVNNVKGGFYF